MRRTCWVGILAGVACSSPTKSERLGAARDTSADGNDSGPSVDSAVRDSAVDSAEDSGVGGISRRCPDGMVPVPPDEPLYCIDQYEASEDASGGSLVSVEGAIPVTGVSFLEARALCENSPAMVEGEVVGWRRLASLAEWGDAADGVVGEGGSTFPTGETWPEGDCAVLAEDGSQRYSELQPTGSLPACVSAFGTFDQLGNAWEWADPGIEMSIADFLVWTSENELELTIDEDGRIHWLSGSLDNLYLEIPGAFASIGNDGDGEVVATEVVWQAELPFDFVGYLVGGARSSSSRQVVMVPVELAQPPDGATTADQALLRVRWDQDGAPVTAKVGCAYYTGVPEGCANASWFFGHPPEFSGTIGVRCAADPVP